MRANIGVNLQDFRALSLHRCRQYRRSRIEARDNRTRIVAAAGRSLADEVIRKLPKGYDQIIASAFAPASIFPAASGQKVAIARAYYARRAASDPRRANGKRSMRVQNSRCSSASGIEPGQTGGTDIAPLSSVRMADRIVVPDGWRCRGHGHPRRIAGAGGALRGIVRTKAAGYR